MCKCVVVQGPSVSGGQAVHYLEAHLASVRDKTADSTSSPIPSLYNPPLQSHKIWPLRDEHRSGTASVWQTRLARCPSQCKHAVVLLRPLLTDRLPAPRSHFRRVYIMQSHRGHGSLQLSVRQNRTWPSSTEPKQKVAIGFLRFYGRTLVPGRSLVLLPHKRTLRA